MKRREFMLAGAAALVLPGITGAWQKTAVVGLLWIDSVKPSPHVATLTAALRELGWTRGGNLQMSDRVTLEGYDTLAANAAALVRERCDVIVTYGATSTAAAAKATKDIPIAMITGTDPVRAKLAASLSRPGGNITGISTLALSLVGKRLELLRELAPGLKDVGVLIQRGNEPESLVQAIEGTRAAAAALKLVPHFAHAATVDEIDAGVEGFAKVGLRAVYVSQGRFLAAQSKRVVRAIGTHRLIAVYPEDRFAEQGGLVSYSPGMRKAFIRLAPYVDRLLKGAKAAEMPIEQLSDVELVINLKTARALGVKMPQSVLQRADRAIE